MARPIVIDTDPGQDDAVAILLAFGSPELDVLGITTVAGNVPQPLVTTNALKLCELTGRTDVAVYRGAEGPLERDLYTAEYVHGPTGLDGVDLPNPVTVAEPKHAVDFIIDTCLAADSEGVTLCPIGPLTNIASAIAREPMIVSKIREIVLMGGGFFEGGNTTPVAEFNIYVDPDAAAIVFNSGVPITMFPLDVTHKALVFPEDLERIRAIGTPIGDAVAGMLGFYERHDVEKYGIAGAPLHDPCVIAFLVNPDLFSGKACRVDIETDSELTAGQTVVDWWGVTGADPNAMVMSEVDRQGFIDLVVDRIAGL
ncbi:MAG TPA: nucleoside hydrolase [Acidimicrobiia bacterium]|nr:nucleoside hydrolase [Acidimicrobiia bacterium]